MQEWAYYVQALANLKEGAGSMLDNVLIYANTDQSFAKIHSIEGIPMFTAARPAAASRPALHIDGAGTPGTRLGLTAMKLMGVDLESWGDQSNHTSKVISEILV